MPFVYVRSRSARHLIAETKARVKEETREMSDQELKIELENMVARHSYAQESESKILYHEIKTIKEEIARRKLRQFSTLSNKLEKLTSKLETLKEDGKIKCPHCKKTIFGKL